MERIFVAGRRLRVGDSVRQPGDPIPEAAFFHERIRRAMLNTGHLKKVPISKLDESQQEKLSIYLGNLQPKHIGGGLYLLPDGRKVKGKDNAYFKMEKYGLAFDSFKDVQESEGE